MNLEDEEGTSLFGRGDVHETPPEAPVRAAFASCDRDNNDMRTGDWITEYGFLCSAGFTIREDKEVIIIESFQAERADDNDIQGFGLRVETIVDGVNKVDTEINNSFDNVAGEVSEKGAAKVPYYQVYGMSLLAGNHTVTCRGTPSAEMEGEADGLVGVKGSVLVLITD